MIIINSKKKNYINKSHFNNHIIKIDLNLIIINFIFSKLN